MKPLEILSLFFIVGFAIVYADNTPICWDHPNPLKPSERKRAPCYSATNTNSNDLSLTKRDDSDMFNVTFTCLANNQTLCNKVKNAFDTAGQIITAAIAFKIPVTVNATFTDFCSTLSQCSLSSGTLTLGGAAPARTIQITDDDGVQRLFPQSLVKQRNFTGGNHTYSAFDIFAIFNSQADYWFEGDGRMKDTQSDFLFVILHELIHGLGFTSGYDDFFNVPPKALTPQVSFVEGTGGFTFNGFVEMIFDKCMVILPSGQRVSNITNQLNTFKGTFTSIQDFVTTFNASSQHQLALNMMVYATTPNSLGLLPPKSTDISNATILETTLNPYRSGSSVSHFDYKTYTRTSDFLMRYLQERGLTLRQSIYLGGNYPNGPIGPKLRSFLQSMGYTIQYKPGPFDPIPGSHPFDDTDSAGKPNAEICLSFISYISSFLLIGLVITLW
ncbi:3397_t:CDS:2 [Dentiscutata erythropus]|uniref:3397_t:CDS:1 n=1 Tax=Dentiscutata erythropus TaxID=1348616 RepID=A0A9N8YVF0_9GLOM|nr:3397_t:CDS:2 [Dentiscutata erythropus]